ncbi:MAG: hypothetical protein Q4C14_06320 [Bacillota bacterium]|nr:hypothetical protein [Bacillota bacterium]
MDNSEKNIVVFSGIGDSSLSALDLRNPETIKKVNISAAGGLHGITVCENRQFLYFADMYGNRVGSYNIYEGRAGENTSAGAAPCHIAVRGGLLYVSNSDSDSISVIDSEDMSAVISIPSGRMPHDMAVWNSSVLAAESGPDSIGIIDGVNCEYGERIQVKCSPAHICRIPGKDIFAAACTEYGLEIKGYICLINMERPGLEERIRVGHCLTDIEADEDGVHVFVTDGGRGSIYKVNILNGLVVGNLNLSGFPVSVSAGCGNGRITVVDGENRLIYILRKDTFTVEKIVRGRGETAHLLCI